jgi:superfamily II DNA/RNA helicase
VRVDMAPPPKAAPGITQAIYPVSKALKFDLLDEMMSRTEVRSTILFCRHRAGCERVARALQKRGYSVSILDEHPSQGEREARLEDLRRGRSQILCASDAAARSLDVTGVSHVVNVDVPQTPEDYVHRLGRTGRQDPVGDVFTLMSPEEQREVAAIERLLGRAILRVVLPDFDYQMQPREFQQVVSYDEATREQTRRPGGLQNAATRISVVPRGSSTTSGNGRPTAAVALPVQKAGGSSASKSARPSHQAKRPKASTTRKRSAAKPARRSRPVSARPKAKRSTARRGHGAAKRR